MAANDRPGSPFPFGERNTIEHPRIDIHADAEWYVGEGHGGFYRVIGPSRSTVEDALAERERLRSGSPYLAGHGTITLPFAPTDDTEITCVYCSSGPCAFEMVAKHGGRKALVGLCAACRAGFEDRPYSSAATPVPKIDPPRFVVEHDVIHDRVTGKHVRSTPRAEMATAEDAIDECCALLNRLADEAADNLALLARGVELFGEQATDKKGSDAARAYGDLALAARCLFMVCGDDTRGLTDTEARCVADLRAALAAVDALSKAESCAREDDLPSVAALAEGYRNWDALTDRNASSALKASTDDPTRRAIPGDRPRTAEVTTPSVRCWRCKHEVPEETTVCNAGVGTQCKDAKACRRRWCSALVARAQPCVVGHERPAAEAGAVGLGEARAVVEPSRVCSSPAGGVPREPEVVGEHVP